MSGPLWLRFRRRPDLSDVLRSRTAADDRRLIPLTAVELETARVLLGAAGTRRIRRLVRRMARG